MTDIHRINMPQWGLEMTEGTIAAWHIAPGDRIVKGSELVDIETAKIVSTMEATGDMPGVVRRLVGKIGDTVAVGGLLGLTADPEVTEAELDAFLAEAGVAPAAPAAAEPASAPVPNPASTQGPAPAAAQADPLAEAAPPAVAGSGPPDPLSP